MLRSKSAIVSIAASDGIMLAARIYMPEGEGPFPTLFAASPYRFDNDDIPETCTFLWRETAPIDWYVEQGYAYVHMDVRGTGRSEGEYRFFDSRERRDLYDAIEWIAAQPWSTGKVGGIGHSYYATTQWAMASERPPHLACIAPYDGHCDIYRGWAYHGGIPGNFLVEWWENNVRPINLRPLSPDAPSRDIERDLMRELALHPTMDDFWQERAFADKLEGCTIPLLSIGVWSKLDLHTAGNIEGFRRFAGDKWLMMTAAPHMSAAQADFESVTFHEQHLLPFYHRYLKDDGKRTLNQPAVRFAARAHADIRSADEWPPKSEMLTLNLSPQASGAVQSLNDGSLIVDDVTGAAETAYSYPDKDWSLGNVFFGPTGPDPVARNLTFTTAPLAADLEMAGEAVLTVYLSGSRDDADVIVKLVEAFPGDAKSPPRSVIVTKGWVRASHRNVIDRDYGVRHEHSVTQPIVPGEVYELEIGLVPMAYRFSRGSRIRLDLSCADSPVTDHVFAHRFTPDKVGTDTIHHGGNHMSRIELPILGHAPIKPF